jgi:hypothetical protein
VSAHMGGHSSISKWRLTVPVRVGSARMGGQETVGTDSSISQWRLTPTALSG